MRKSVMSGIAMVAAVLAVAGCGGQGEPAGDTSGGLEITFHSDPEPPTPGDNGFIVTVRDAEGQPVTDAHVSVEFVMPAMPEMDMPEMRGRTDLAHEGDGRYGGRGDVMMAGGWEVTITVSRDGRSLGTRTLSVIAR